MKRSILWTVMINFGWYWDNCRRKQSYKVYNCHCVRYVPNSSIHGLLHSVIFWRELKSSVFLINVQLFSVYLCISYGKDPKHLEYKSVRNFLACFNQYDFNFHLCWYLYLLNNEVRDLVLMVFNDIHSY